MYSFARVLGVQRHLVGAVLWDPCGYCNTMGFSTMKMMLHQLEGIVVFSVSLQETDCERVCISIETELLLIQVLVP